MRCSTREKIRLHDILHIDEVARLFTIAVDRRRLIAQEALDEFWNDRCVCSVRILPPPIDVEVAHPIAIEPIIQRILIRILLINEFRHCIRREAPSDDLLSLRHRLIVAVDGRA